MLGVLAARRAREIQASPIIPCNTLRYNFMTIHCPDFPRLSSVKTTKPVTVWPVRFAQFMA